MPGEACNPLWRVSHSDALVPHLSTLLFTLCWLRQLFISLFNHPPTPEGRWCRGGISVPPLIWRVYPAECAQSHKTAHMDTGARLLERAHRREAKLVFVLW